MATSAVIRRNRPGTKSKELYSWKPQEFGDMESTLAVQQYIQQLIRKDYRDIDSLLELPQGQDETVWKYEHLRQFCNEMNGLAVKLQEECDPLECKQMTATEQWIFLCAAHKNPQECSAIDYTLHTLHGAASLLNSNKHFPSRVTIKETSVPRLSSVSRRIYRIFAHAYFHHRKLYDEYEDATCLCQRFTRYVLKYDLMALENLMVPVEGGQPEMGVADPPTPETETTGLPKGEPTSEKDKSGQSPSVVKLNEDEEADKSEVTESESSA